METDQDKNEIQEGVGAGGDNQTESKKPHPLIQPLILWRLFDHLNPHELLVCKQVCSDWLDSMTLHPSLEIPITLNQRNIERFNILMTTSPQATLYFRNVTLGWHLDLGSCFPTIIFERNGADINSLKIDSNLAYIFFIHLPRNCPNLVKLDVYLSTIISSVEIPDSLKSNWENPFPHLKSLTIRLTENYDLFGFPGDDPTLPFLREITKFRNFVIFILSKGHSLKQLSLINCHSTIWKLIAEQLSQEPNISSRIKKLHIDCSTLEPDASHSLWTTPGINLTILEIQNLSMTTESFSALLKMLAPTLQKLIMDKYPDSSYYGWLDNFTVHFSCEMKALKYFEINCQLERTTPVPVLCSGSKDANPCNVFKLLPNLKYFKQILTSWPLHTELLNRISRKQNGKQFWEAIIIPANSLENGLLQNHPITELTTNLIFPIDTVKQFVVSFPHLKTFAAGFDGETLLEVVTSMSSFKIEKLRISYYTTEKGLDEFTSAIGGISYNDCENYETLVQSGQEIPKTHDSLAEWKYLRVLTVIMFASDGENGQQVLNDVSIQEGFAKMTQLRKLKMRNFHIDSRHITTLLDNIPLENLKLANSVVDFSNSEEQGGPTSMQAIRDQYPRVLLHNPYW